MSEGLPAASRWLAALAYLGPGFLLGLLSSRREPRLIWHLQQGFALFFAAMVALTLLAIIDGTLGQIPVLGFLLNIICILVVMLGWLTASVLGFVKALADEEWEIPWLAEYARRVPIS